MRCRHPFQLPDVYRKLFSTQRTFRNFINETIRLSTLLPLRSDDDRNKFKGDVLETLAEIFFTSFGTDPRVGLINYEPVPINEDYGVDAIGTNVNGDRCMVQVKFRSNPLDVVTYADISRTFCSGILRHNLDYTKDRTIFVFTSANEVSHQCREVLGNKLVVASREFVKHLIDNNNTFWERASEEVESILST